jgi:ribulose bisphosphate carboxylase small subunit
MGSANYLQAIKPDTAKIRKLVESSLLSDWVIRLEYETGKMETADWQQWDEAMFAVRSAEPVLTALSACYSKYPDCTIRINAEKIRPQTRMLYTVYNPGYVTADTKIRPEQSGYSCHGKAGILPAQPRRNLV